MQLLHETAQEKYWKLKKQEFNKVANQKSQFKGMNCSHINYKKKQPVKKKSEIKHFFCINNTKKINAK